MEKSADAFRTISEVADDLDLPQHVLRFWETRFQQIRPLKRAGGRRYYRPPDIVLLRAIRQLLYDEGYTIKGVQRLLKEQGARGLSTASGAPSAIEPALEALDPDELAFEPAFSEAESSPPADHRSVLPSDREAVRDALALIEDCEAILTAARGPRS